MLPLTGSEEAVLKLLIRELYRDPAPIAAKISTPERPLGRQAIRKIALIIARALDGGRLIAEGGPVGEWRRRVTAQLRMNAKEKSE